VILPIVQVVLEAIDLIGIIENSFVLNWLKRRQSVLLVKPFLVEPFLSGCHEPGLNGLPGEQQNNGRPAGIRVYCDEEEG